MKSTPMNEIYYTNKLYHMDDFLKYMFVHGFRHKDVITNVEENYTWMMKGSTYKFNNSDENDQISSIRYMDEIGSYEPNYIHD